MKRDFDLIRHMLSDIEAMPAGEAIRKFEYPEYDLPTIEEHVRLINEAGFIKGNISEVISGRRTCSIFITGLSWDGHDFLDAMKDDNIWNKAKESILKPGASITFGLLLEWLKIEAKQKIGIP